MKTEQKDKSLKLNFAPKVLVVKANFYPELTDALYEGAMDVLEQVKANVVLVEVEGALEVPQALNLCMHNAMQRGKPFDAALCFGVVIRGETYHFEVVCNESARAIMNIALETKTAVANGILTVETYEQAVERAQKGQLNKGGEAAYAALKLLEQVGATIA